MESQLTCPHCKKDILPSDYSEQKISGSQARNEVNILREKENHGLQAVGIYFCPKCGKKLKDKLPSTTFSKQLIVYAISFFLPPFGLWPAIRYLRQQDDKSKKIGLAAIFLTIISILLTIWLTTSFINSFNKELNNQLRLYQDIGY